MTSTQFTNSLPAGTSKRIEYPVNGKKVRVTRVVRDRNGNVIHKDTYFSHYKTVTGIVLIGRGSSTASRRPVAASPVSSRTAPRASGRAIPGRWPRPRSR